jgi:hypothetical protein
MEDDDSDLEESDKVKKERNEIRDYLILSFIDRTKTAQNT